MFIVRKRCLYYPEYRVKLSVGQVKAYVSMAAVVQPYV